MQPGLQQERFAGPSQERSCRAVFRIPERFAALSGFRCTSVRRKECDALCCSVGLCGLPWPCELVKGPGW